MFEYEYGEASRVARQSHSGCPRPGKSQHVFRGLAERVGFEMEKQDEVHGVWKGPCHTVTVIYDSPLRNCLSKSLSRRVSTRLPSSAVHGTHRKP